MSRVLLPASLLALSLFAGSVAAQDYDRPPAALNDDSGSDYPAGGGDYGRAPVDAPDPASLAVRVGKLESRIREMTGQIEELQNNNRRLVEQIQKMQADVDSRAPGSSAKTRRSEADASAVSSGAGEEASATRPRTGRRDDAFDPDAAAADAPGRPKPLGSAASAQEGAGAPMDLAGGKLRREADGGSIAPTLHLPSSGAKNDADAHSAAGTVVASTGPATPPATGPRAEYEAALGLFKDKQYESAEKGFSEFLQKNPKTRYAADATFFLGESYAKRGRSREAAEQYLKISTDYATTPRAPDAMLHLGMSLKALGAKEQACATFSEVARKYPNAPDYVKSGAEREAKRAQC